MRENKGDGFFGNIAGEHGEIHSVFKADGSQDILFYPDVGEPRVYRNVSFSNHKVDFPKGEGFVSTVFDMKEIE